MLSGTQQASAEELARIREQIAEITVQLERASHGMEDVEDAKTQMSTAMLQLLDIDKGLTIIHGALAKRPPTLLTIPREIRDKIYGHLKIVKNEGHYYPLDGHLGPVGGLLWNAPNYYSLTLTCTQLHDEVDELFWSGNTFRYQQSFKKSKSPGMSNGHMHLIKRWEVKGNIKIPGFKYPRSIEMNCCRGTIMSHGNVWKVSGNDLVLIKEPRPRDMWCARGLVEPLAILAIPILQKLQDATKDGHPMEWKLLRRACKKIAQLPDQHNLLQGQANN